MKRLLAVLALVAICAMMFVGCSSAKCEFCGGDASDTVNFLGETKDVCGSCKSQYELGYSIGMDYAEDLLSDYL